MEKLKVHICPVGFEYQRILRGLRAYPCNILYLLESEISKKDYKNKNSRKFEKDKEIVSTSKKFANRVKKSYELIAEVSIRQCSFIRYTKCIKDLTEVIHDIFAMENNNQTVDGIWINIGTASKLFATAAMIVCSFDPERIHLFYVSSGNYTINLLFDEKQTRESIAKIYQENGLTYGKEGYEIVDVPVIKSVKLSLLAKNFICEILKYSKLDSQGEIQSDWVSYQDILNGLGEKIDEKTVNQGRAVKMKYLHHVNQLLERKFIEKKMESREKIFKLTVQGIIMALIAQNLPNGKDNNSHSS
ncbi:MAG: HFX_2341 family transcriptional regulator domain-containing protein [Promethearchaeota archaeon]